MGCIFKFRNFILLLFYFTIAVILSGPDKKKTWQWFPAWTLKSNRLVQTPFISYTYLFGSFFHQVAINHTSCCMSFMALREVHEKYVYSGYSSYKKEVLMGTKSFRSKTFASFTFNQLS